MSKVAGCAVRLRDDHASRAINRLMTGDEQEHVNAVVAALSAGKLDDPWPEHLQLPDALDELTRWLSDDHQWGAPQSASHWRSLIQDVVDALSHLGPSGQTELVAKQAITELEQCAAAFESKPAVKDPVLRERLSQCADDITKRTEAPNALMAAWDDVVASAADRDVAVGAARAFLSLATWMGHDAGGVVSRITRALDGEEAMRMDGELVSPPTGVPLGERLSAARAAVAVEPATAHMTVWLRFRLAQIRSPPTIPIGEEARIYRGDWLQSCLCAPSPRQDLPPEAAGPDANYLRDFCGVEQAHVEAGGPPHDPNEIPTAYIRVVVGEQLAARGVEIARSNAEALAALGAVYGEEPTMWRLDRSYLVFSGDRLISSSDEAEESEWTETVGVAEDRTAEIIHRLSERLAGHVPFRDTELEQAMAMFGWLRGARSAPLAARLVLCDRVIEAVCGWVGMRSRDAFVREHVIPWWALLRIEFLVTKVARRLLYSHPPARLPADDPLWAAWEEIVNHEPLGLRKHPPKVKTSILVAEAPWLLERVPLDTPLGRDLTELDRRTRTGADALAYWDSWQARGQRIERRRLRTRNAIIHGGPLSPATVDSVALFAEHLASQALITSLDAKLEGKTIASHFQHQQARITDMRRRLQQDDPNDPPGDILFIHPK
jgi:hypothetical protein